MKNRVNNAAQSAAAYVTLFGAANMTAANNSAPYLIVGSLLVVAFVILCMALVSLVLIG